MNITAFFEMLPAVTLSLLQGFGVTVLLFVCTLVIALPFGMLITAGAMSRIKPISMVVRGIVYVIRGTPLLLQLMIVVYLPGIAFGAPITKWAMFGGSPAVAYFCGALAAFSLNYACYFSEIYRGGMLNVPRGQWEAGQVLGMTRTQIFFRIILLQVVRSILAPMSNEIITLVKDTALARSVSVMEILFCSYEMLRNDFIIWPLFYSGVFYLAFNALLTSLFNRLEKKLAYIR